METLAPLTPLDRCDRCGAQAHLRAWLPDSELLFCSHHAKEHHPALAAMGVTLEPQP